MLDEKKNDIKTISDILFSLFGKSIFLVFFDRNPVYELLQKIKLNFVYFFVNLYRFLRY